MPLSEGATRARHARRLLQRVLDFVPEGTTIHPIVRIGRHAAEGIVEAAAEQEADLLIFGWGGKTPSGRDGAKVDADDQGRRPRAGDGGPRRTAHVPVISPTIDEVVRESPGRHRRRQAARLVRAAADPRPGPRRSPRRARPALRRRPRPPPRRRDLRPPPRAAGDHPGRPRPGGAGPDGVRQAARHRQGRGARPRGRQRPQRDPARGDARRPRGHGRVGRRPAPTATARPTSSGRSPRRSPRAPSRPSSSSRPARPSRTGTFEQLAARAESLAAADRAAEEARAVPARVERWFAEANFHHAEFSDLRRLVQLKEKQGLTISLVLPTLDEEETIGPIVRRAMRELMGRVPLLDEILVIDSASTDRTREIAEAEGARVVQHPDVLPRYGSFTGKGEALWKSLYETSGDIIVWADTDVRNWHPRMVYGTLGPAARRAAPPVRQGLLPAPDRRGRPAQGGRRRTGHRARRPAAHQPLLPGAVGPHPAAVRRVRGAPVASSRRSRSSPATRSRSATSSTSPSGSGSRASARSTSSGGSTATRSSRACRG